MNIKNILLLFAIFATEAFGLHVASSSYISEDDPKVQDCINDCPASSAESPVCGSNGKTYDNVDRLICATICKVDVFMASEGPCPDLPPTDKPDTGKTLPTGEDDPVVQECIGDCPASSASHPVCGSNGRTYLNGDKLICASLCGVDVSMTSEGPCALTTPPPTEKPDKGKTTLDEDDPVVQECMGDCPASSASLPVCGSNGRTYLNGDKLICASLCGVDVSMVSEGPCALTTPRPTEKPDKGKTTLDEDDPEILECIGDCPASSASNPVCGSNGRTYVNGDKLTCASICGVDVTMASKGPCPDVSLPIDDAYDEEMTTPPLTKRAPNCRPRPTILEANSIIFPDTILESYTDNSNLPICPENATPNDSESSTKKPGRNEQDPAVRRCISSCPVTSEYNPLCGTNGQTYTNPSRLSCASSCGVDVTMTGQGPCPNRPSSQTQQ